MSWTLLVLPPRRQPYHGRVGNIRGEIGFLLGSLGIVLISSREEGKEGLKKKIVKK